MHTDNIKTKNETFLANHRIGTELKRMCLFSLCLSAWTKQEKKILHLQVILAIAESAVT
jgi:hypothetical protein